MPDGSLLISDSYALAVYRISYNGTDSGTDQYWIPDPAGVGKPMFNDPVARETPVPGVAG
jgi:hypothetical protein